MALVATYSSFCSVDYIITLLGIVSGLFARYQQCPCSVAGEEPSFSQRLFPFAFGEILSLHQSSEYGTFGALDPDSSHDLGLS